MKIKIAPDLRTAAEWKAWARAKIADEPRKLTGAFEIIGGKVEITGEIGEMEPGHCIEFDPENLSKQQIISKTLKERK